MTPLLILLFILLPYLLSVAIAMAWREHHRRIECIACRNRRKMVRCGVLLLIGLLVLSESQIHPPDFGFLILAIVFEVS